MIFELGMGIAGAALATVISQCCMAVYVIVQLCSRKMPVRLGFYKFQIKLSRRITAIGSMSFLITVLDNLIIILLNIVLRKYGGPARGDQLITCATVVQSFLTIVSCPVQGIVSGCGTIFSYHYGARNYKKIRQAFLGIFILSGIYIGILEIGVQVFPRLFDGLFLQDESLSLQAAASLRMYTLALLGVAVQYTLVDGLTAMEKVRFAFPLSVFRKVIYVVCIIALPMFLDIRYVFYAGSISDGVGAVFSLFLFFFLINPKLKQELQ